MDPQNQLTVFLAEFDFQVDQILKIYKQLKSKLPSIEKSPVSLETVESTGYWLHNLYCAYEELFKRVAGFWENNVSADGEYHIHLLRRMLLEIKGVRPPLLSEKSYNFLNGLRGFRHVFRHAYSYGLDDAQVHSFIKNDIMDIETFRSIILGRFTPQASR
jgi:uncharacterized protein YutE (UPF0331/DUF86 family)